MTDLRRPKSIEELLERMPRFRSAAATAAVQHFSSRPSDVFICTYPKSGTTWMQQIVHQIRSGGSMDFDEISVVVPWIESAVDLAIDPAAEQAWEPRVFKSHLSCTKIPPGGRYITVFRDPLTVLPSFHRFFEGWFFESGSISVTDFGRGLYMGGSASGRHWQHLIDWWPRIGDADVLALSYEDMLRAADAVPALVAEFLTIELNAETLQQVVYNCGRKSMTEHAEKFAEGILRVHRDHILGLPPGGSAAKVNAQSSGGLPPELVHELDAIWASTVGIALGFTSYDEFRRALPNPLGAPR